MLKLKTKICKFKVHEPKLRSAESWQHCSKNLGLKFVIGMDYGSYTVWGHYNDISFAGYCETIPFIYDQLTFMHVNSGFYTCFLTRLNFADPRKTILFSVTQLDKSAKYNGIIYRSYKQMHQQNSWLSKQYSQHKPLTIRLTGHERTYTARRNSSHCNYRGAQILRCPVP